MNDAYTWMATAAFGIEGLVADELRALSARNVRCENGRVFFEGDAVLGAKANLWLRCADRVFLVMGEFPAATFDELFEGVRALPWGDFLPKDASFDVARAKSINSKLFSLSDSQAITKKAIAEAMKRKYKADWFQETGARFPVEVALNQDVATVSVDASGTGLHRRGYRPMTAEAPLRETIAAALVRLSYYRGGIPLHDPLCGSGTLPIEAAMAAKNIAPGLLRSFVSEIWPLYKGGAWEALRQEAIALKRTEPIENITGTDIDERALLMARRHAQLAGVERDIHFQRMDVRDISSKKAKGQIITNPPYGQRLGDKKSAEKLAEVMGRAFEKLPGWFVGVITADTDFPKHFGRRAKKNRKLFNGKIQCYYYQFDPPERTQRR
ncbi:MAG: THUMP domain-containing class I SAM-dependent RNA methyltransferase [Christensenellales bacterium]|jgi:putative N6-adenine-specific DNA methylase